MDPDASLAAPRRRALRSPGPLVIALDLGALVLVTAAITPWSSVRRAPQPGTVAAPGGNAENAVAASSAAAASRRLVTGITGNQRYFVDQTGRAILVRGDSPWAMMTDLSPRQARHYLDNRKKYGVNALIVSLVGAEANGGPSDDGATFDGIRPFVRNDITRPNKNY